MDNATIEILLNTIINKVVCDQWESFLMSTYPNSVKASLTTSTEFSSWAQLADPHAIPNANDTAAIFPQGLSSFCFSAFWTSLLNRSVQSLIQRHSQAARVPAVTESPAPIGKVFDWMSS
jgi:hypothetical protein